METTGFWTRVGHWFRRSDQSVPARRSSGDAGEESSTATGGSGPGSELLSDNRDDMRLRTLGRGTGDGSKSLSRLRMSRSGLTMERLAEEYGRVVNLVDAIQKHLSSQAQQSERIARSLDRLAEGLSHFPETSQKELELLGAISRTVDADLLSAKRVEESLSQLPKLADAQRETMVSIGRQLNVSREAGERMVDTVRDVGQTVTKVGEATEASTRNIQEMRWDAAARDERVAVLLEEQTRRFAIFAWVAIGLAVVAVAAGVYAVLG